MEHHPTFFYLEKYFDTKNQQHWSLKKELHGFRESVLTGLSFLLQNWCHCVEIEGIKFHLEESLCGVPQRSVLEPPPFITITKYVHSLCCIFKQFLFAKETEWFSGTECMGQEQQNLGKTDCLLERKSSHWR